MKYAWFSGHHRQFYCTEKFRTSWHQTIGSFVLRPLRMVEMPSPPLSPPAAAGQHTAEKKHRRKKRRGGIGGQPIRKPPKPVHDDPRPLAEKRAAYRAATGAPDKKGQEKRRITKTIADRLPELWLDSYDGPLW